MASAELLLLVGVPENYRLGGPAFQKLHRAHPRVRVQIVHDPAAFAGLARQADAVIGSRPYLRLPPEVLRPEGRLRWMQTTTAGVDHVLNPELIAAEHVIITCLKGPPGPRRTRKTRGEAGQSKKDGVGSVVHGIAHNGFGSAV